MSIESKEPEFLRLIFSDILGHLRSVEVGIDRLEDVLEHGVVVDGSSVPGYASVNESDVLLISSSATPTIQPWDPSAAYLLCRVYTPAGRPHPNDPRNILDQVIMNAARIGVQLMIGSELEFFTIRRTPESQIEPDDSAGYFSSRPSDPSVDFRRDIIRTLTAVGIQTTSHHHEVARGQHEIGLQYMPASIAADNILLARQIIMEMAALSGRSVTFMPKPFSDQNGSGLHLHQSVWSDDGERNLFATEAKGEISQLARNYVGGLLAHAPFYTALLAPIVNSYKRLIPGFEAPTKIAWGYRNRSTMIRVPHFNGSERAARIELRCPDPAISPHLGIAAILAAGMDGIRRDLEPGKPISANLYHSVSDIDSLPESLGEALRRLMKSKLLADELGKSAIDAFVSLRTNEWNEYNQTTDSSDTPEITTWEYEKYLHVN